MKDYLRLMRIKHYIKNMLVFIPMFFGGFFFDKDRILRAALGFIAFSLLASIVYVLNDLRDVEHDRKHPTKKNRPLASGVISKNQAIIVVVFLALITVAISVYLENNMASFCLLGYLLLNVVYSMGLKNVPIIDIVILASGFIIRVLYGGFITEVMISKWLYLVIVTGSLYMGLGKRRNEIRSHTDTREVLKLYNESFLDKYMYVCVALVNVFYSLWSIEMPNSRMIWTVPIFMVLLMCYSLDVEGDSEGDPVEVILHDKALIGVIIAYALCVFLILYVF